MQTDLTIIGCGLAGLVELRQALIQKKSVTVVADGFGATQYMNGVFDFPEARAFCEFYGVPVVSVEAVCTIGPVGQVRQVGRVGCDSAMLATQGLLSEVQKIKKILFVEFSALPDFPSSLVVPNLKKSFLTVNSICFNEISLNHTSPHAHLLQLFDNESCAEVLRDFIQRHKGDAELIVIPPVLGIRNFADIHQKLEKDLGVRIVEQLSTTPPVAGLRFTHIIKKFFEEKKINVVWGRVSGYHAEKDEVRSVAVQGAIIEAQEFILATGKFLGGGISFEDGVRETVFGFPCSTGDGVVSKHVPITRLIHCDPLQEQDIFKLGVVVNEAGCPVDPISKKAIYKNVKMVGDVKREA